MKNFIHVYVINGVPKPWNVDCDFVKFEIFTDVEPEEGHYFFRVKLEDNTAKNNFIGLADEDYIIYKDIKYTKETFGQLMMLLENEKTMAAIEGL